ncbi:MAG: TRAM domain-containing protein [Halobacteriales archaeon]
MEISDQLLCLFNAPVRSEDGEYTVSIPRREVENGAIDPDTVYRIAVIAPESTAGGSEPHHDQPEPPVEVGETRYVEIEDIGKQGDGIARVERGYVIIVPGAEVGDRVKVEIAEVKPNFAVGEVVEETF